jgi:hypothetical protein
VPVFIGFPAPKDFLNFPLAIPKGLGYLPHTPITTMHSEIEFDPRRPDLLETSRRLFSRKEAQRVESIKRSPEDLERLAARSGWKVLSAFAVKMQSVDSHNEWRMSQGLWANRKFFWSEKMTACVVNALRATPDFQTCEERDHQHECDESDAFRKGEF